MNTILRSYKAQDSMDGAGVELKRVFGYYQKEIFDPFLMLDHIETSYPKAGFPWHPHRGIETITVMLKGKTYHEDSMGNSGTLEDGDIQWMKAASGILHQEIPDKDSEEFELLQFWLNMPKQEKMTTPEYTYMNILKDNIIEKDHLKISVVAGSYESVKGPIQKKSRNITLLYTEFLGNGELVLNRKKQTNAFIYVLSGNGDVNNEKIEQYTIYQLAEQVIKITATKGTKIIFAEGAPLNEPIEWYGPIVMNTKEEIQTAKNELANGTFLKS